MSKQIRQKRYSSGDVNINKRQRDQHRASIRVAAILQLLDNNAHGALKKNDGTPYTLNAGQVKSAEVLLSKALPSLQTVDDGKQDDRPKHSPEELKEQILAHLPDLLQQIPREDVLKMIGEPELKIIEGEVL